MKLHSFWRSSSSWRVRIALHHKRLDFEYVAVDLNPERKAHQTSAFTELNPQQQVPLLEVPEPTGSRYLSQSVAIIEHLEEIHPEPSLLPGEAWQRAEARRIAEMINSGTQPLQNSGVLDALATLGLDSAQVADWARYWISRGLNAIERIVDKSSSHGRYCVGDELSLADVYLIPQVYNARRFGVALEPLQRVRSIEAHCTKLDAFRRAHPNAQPDTPESQRLESQTEAP